MGLLSNRCRHVGIASAGMPGQSETSYSLFGFLSAAARRSRCECEDEGPIGGFRIFQNCMELAKGAKPAECKREGQHRLILHLYRGETQGVAVRTMEQGTRGWHNAGLQHHYSTLRLESLDMNRFRPHVDYSC